MNNDKNALYNLLEDDDFLVYTPVMQKILETEKDADQFVREYQDSANPSLRARAFEMGRVLKLRNRRKHFISDVVQSKVALWDALLDVNFQLNPALSKQKVQQLFDKLANACPEAADMKQFSAALKRIDLAMTKEDVLGADLYLLEEVLQTRLGSSILLCVIAQQLAARMDLAVSVVLYRGRHCICDAHGVLLDPVDAWKLIRVKSISKVHYCSDKDILVMVLCQLFLSAMLDGSLNGIHRIGTILTGLCGGKLSDLPFPIGKKSRN
ncbi:MAG: hypothetical protein MK193_12385 [Lentisphaeria bacterium]|nr:hypothetical protein [Lentisphaeria bacterium]